MLQEVVEGQEIAYQLISLRQAIDQLEVQFSRLAKELDGTTYWAEDGSNSSIDWIRFNCHMTSNAAADRVAVGRAFGSLGQSVQALDEGAIGFAHLSVMTRTANAVGDAFDETKLLQLARESSPGKFHYKCMHYRHSVNPKKYADEQAELGEERCLRLSPQEDGCLLVTGLLDPVGGATLRTALEPLARPPGARDYRKREQRLADALVELATHGGKVKVAMQVTSSVETLLGLVGSPGAENEFSLPISSKTVERWACDCSLSRILLQDSVVIDVGRAERTIKGPRRRALIARDRHCQWPGCERPASWCDGHHIVHWLFGGGGEIENQILLCARHHRLVHEGGYQLIRTEKGEIVAIAPTLMFGAAPPALRANSP
ncbi:MAG TPA: DUF222 domain-containing protein [Candidatus Dormibacteraeota bacterium]